MEIVTLIIAISAITFDIVLTIVLVKMRRQIKRMRNSIFEITVSIGLLYSTIDMLLMKLKDKNRKQKKQKNQKNGGILGDLDDIISNIAETFTNVFEGAMK